MTTQDELSAAVDNEASNVSRAIAGLDLSDVLNCGSAGFSVSTVAVVLIRFNGAEENEVVTRVVTSSMDDDQKHAIFMLGCAIFEERYGKEGENVPE